MHGYIYIYIYICLSLSVSLFTHIYIYIHISNTLRFIPNPTVQHVQNPSRVKAQLCKSTCAYTVQ